MSKYKVRTVRLFEGRFLNKHKIVFVEEPTGVRMKRVHSMSLVSVGGVTLGSTKIGYDGGHFLESEIVKKSLRVLQFIEDTKLRK